MLPKREKVLRKKIHDLTTRDNESGILGIQQRIYQKTGLMAKNYFTNDELEYLYKCLPSTTRKMLKLCGRNKPSMLSMYDLRHSLISTQGADAAMKIFQAERVSLIAFEMIKQNKEDRPVRILELGSGLSDVSAMIHTLLVNNLSSYMNTDQIKNSFYITNVEYEYNTMTLASEYMTNRPNIRVVKADAANLSIFPDNMFDICITSLMLGAFNQPDSVIDEARRVVKNGGIVVHSDFVYLYGKSDTKWSRVKNGHKTFIPVRLDSISFLSKMKGLMKADHYLYYKKIPEFFSELNYKVTTSEFNYWSWFDAGDYAAWYITERNDQYKNIKEERFCGSVPSFLKAGYSLWKLMRYNWKEMDAEELESIMSHCKQAGTAFNMVTAEVRK